MHPLTNHHPETILTLILLIQKRVKQADQLVSCSLQYSTPDYNKITLVSFSITLQLKISKTLTSQYLRTISTQGIFIVHSTEIWYVRGAFDAFIFRGEEEAVVECPSAGPDYEQRGRGLEHEHRASIHPVVVVCWRVDCQRPADHSFGPATTSKRRERGLTCKAVSTSIKFI